MTSYSSRKLLKLRIILIEEQDVFLGNLLYQVKYEFFNKISDYKAKLNECIQNIEEKLKSTIYKELYREVMAELMKYFEEDKF
ncbi:MAG: hypothetical protein ACTSU4_06425 [Promethearchaeota archaeon]